MFKPYVGLTDEYADKVVRLRSLNHIGKESIWRSDNVYLLDNGHGGIVNGEYVTSGKRSPIWPDGRVLYEGDYNRSIVTKLVHCFQLFCGIDCFRVSPEDKDIGLRQRVRRANAFAQSEIRPCYFISIHANGFPDPSAKGIEVWTSPGATKADLFAELLFEQLTGEIKESPARFDRGDGDSDKESKFTVLMETSMPAVLTENCFMTNPEECEWMFTEEFRDRIAIAHFRAILLNEGLNIK